MENNPTIKIDKEMDKRFWIVQNVCDRICDAHESKQEFIDELEALMEKFPLNYRVEYQPKVFEKKIKIGCE